MEASKKVNSQLLSKLATSDQHGENSPYFDGWKAYDKDPFHPTTNPNGVIQMGLAENQLSLDLVEEWIKKNPEASICNAEGVHAFKNTALFQDYHGLPEFRQAVARFMEKARGDKVRFDPDRIVMAGGATGANETLMFCLADPGDGFLVPSPYYPAFNRDLRWRTGVKLVPVTCESSNGFQITKEALEEAYENAEKANIKVKGVILSNPSNPLGTTMDRAALRTLVTFINGKQIHLVCDEIYAATVFRGPRFVGISEVAEEMAELVNLDLIHVACSLSKDMGLPGFRVGIVYSYNDAVVSCARKMSSFGLVSSQTQRLLARMLADEEFTERYLSESRRRLARRHEAFARGVGEVGIGCLESNAGVYCWMDLRGMLKEATAEGEMGLWRVIVNEVKLNVSPGSSFHCGEAGWFRVCFANMDDETLGVALKRIRRFVGGGEAAAVVKRSWQRNLKLSFSAGAVAAPRVMSPHSPMPHSPIPHSPLVRAKN
ncbi:LOW QUALITY PROTEIN: 1-aminocyclopropane-1-carboxylate synthase-like [Salvia miltiorrhiza]|uniref:LOW QUALITY PROTEIN: 1-aminocyclopropane-1-carboxylate synthase-like n=1 Tax=Salvia miltiorrhiza TaxID=226208 RepID=UPI0025ACFB7D|nr:LOW QUALITY PROTEIN: 1-aminocyclopropane-1-carboxylate synthase-like [Salvia miltiorrhiza]